MIRAKTKRIRTPRLHELRGGMSHTVGRARVKEDWSFRSGPDRVALKLQGIYILHALDTEFYKIGVAIDPDTRRSELQCGIPFLLDLVYFSGPLNGAAIKIEVAAHAQARKQKRGSPADNEFFRFKDDAEAMDFIKRFCGLASR